MADAQLEPCPFCGGIFPQAFKSEGQFFVHCWSCDADGPTGKTESQAIAAWNRRVKREEA